VFAVLFNRTAPDDGRRDRIVEAFTKLLPGNGLHELSRSPWPIDRSDPRAGATVAIVVGFEGGCRRHPRPGDRELIGDLAYEAVRSVGATAPAAPPPHRRWVANAGWRIDIDVD
jgi:hypothetical protein